MVFLVAWEVVVDGYDMFWFCSFKTLLIAKNLVRLFLAGWKLWGWLQ